MTKVKNTRRRGKLYQIHWCFSFPNWPICWWKWKQVRTLNNVEIFHIPLSLVLNLDQTNRKYISVGKTAMAKKDSNSVSISGLSSKRSMTTTFTITLNGKFLPMQLMYKGKTNQKLPKKIWESNWFFSCLLILNTTVNTAESIKLINGIIIPYSEKEKI